MDAPAPTALHQLPHHLLRLAANAATTSGPFTTPSEEPAN